MSTSVMEKSRTSLMNIGRMRTINFETAKKKKVVIITDHTGTEVTIFDQGIPTSDFLASNFKKITKFVQIKADGSHWKVLQVMDGFN